MNGPRIPKYRPDPPWWADVAVFLFMLMAGPVMVLALYGLRALVIKLGG